MILTGATPRNTATEATWAIPMLMLLPSGLVIILTDLSAPWFVTASAIVGLAAILVVAGWIQAKRNGLRQATGWSTCVATHLVLAWQVARLLP
ncbi:hypothetical protein ACFXJO_02135 [Streptomyces lavendulae]|uniref:hypothetical protein n=1 Tax=Streptomyces lavendulae TaxID=1914 RepID=UPI00369DAB25